MIWKSHYFVTGITVFAITENPVATFFAIQGAVLPDALEFLVPFKLIRHRGITHWWPIYLLPVIAIYLAMLHLGLNPLITPNELIWILQNFTIHEITKIILITGIYWILIGALLHLVEDLFTGYLPFLTPYDRKKIKILFYPGSSKEYIFDYSYLFVILFIKLFQWRLL